MYIYIYTYEELLEHWDALPSVKPGNWGVASKVRRVCAQNWGGRSHQIDSYCGKCDDEPWAFGLLMFLTKPHVGIRKNGFQGRT